MSKEEFIWQTRSGDGWLYFHKEKPKFHRLFLLEGRYWDSHGAKMGPVPTQKDIAIGFFFTRFSLRRIKHES